VVWNDGRLGQIQDDMDSLGIARMGVEVAPFDFGHFAPDHEAEYALCDGDPEGLVERARGAGKPTLIEIREDVAG